MPSLGEIDKLMMCWSQEWKPEPPVDADGDVFNVLWDTAERYYGSNHYGIRPNYERVLGETTALASLLIQKFLFNFLLIPESHPAMRRR